MKKKIREIVEILGASRGNPATSFKTNSWPDAISDDIRLTYWSQ
jgi:hypothetical protein